MTDALPFPLPAEPRGLSSPAPSGPKPADAKIGSQREFSPVLDDARAVVDRRQPPAQRSRPERSVDNGERPRRDPQDEGAKATRSETSTDDAVETDAEDARTSDRLVPASDDATPKDEPGAEGETSSENVDGDSATRPSATTLIALAPPQTEPRPLEMSRDNDEAVDHPTPPTDVEARPGADIGGEVVAADAPAIPIEGATRPEGTATEPEVEVEVEVESRAGRADPGNAVPATGTTRRRGAEQGEAAESAAPAASTGNEPNPLISERQPAESTEGKPPDLVQTVRSQPAAVSDIDVASEPAPEPLARAGQVEASTTIQSASRAEAPSIDAGPAANTPAAAANTAAVVADARSIIAPEAATAKFEIADMVPADPAAGTDEAADELWGQVQRALARVRSGAEGQELRVRLRPAELGELLVQVRTNGEQLTVRLVATSGAAHQTLLNDQPRLAAELRSAGFESGSVDIGQQGQQQGDPNQRSGGRPDPRTQASPASASRAIATGDPQPLDSLRPVSAPGRRGGLVDLTL